MKRQVISRPKQLQVAVRRKVAGKAWYRIHKFCVAVAAPGNTVLKLCLAQWTEHFSRQVYYELERLEGGFDARASQAARAENFSSCDHGEPKGLPSSVTRRKSTAG